jgi:putative peptidoglycan lipid II flippase
VLGPALNVVLFGYGETSIAGARLIGTSLAISAFGLFPFALVMLQLRVFYAMRDGRTPTLINVFMVGSKVLLVLVADATLNGPAHIAEALNTATSISYVVGAIVGHVALTRRLGNLGFRRVARTVAQVSAASVVAAVATLAVVAGSQQLLGRGHVGSLAGLILGGAAGLAVFGALAWRMRIPEIQDIVALARRGTPTRESGIT